MLGSPPPPGPRLKGVPPSLPLGVTVSSGSALAGWVTSDKPLEGNCLQHGLGPLAGLSRGLPGPGAAASLPGALPGQAHPAVRGGRVRACPGGSYGIVLFRPLPGMPNP